MKSLRLVVMAMAAALTLAACGGDAPADGAPPAAPTEVPPS
jgi:ABC-type glycerol-3-phosphate transport system substrate-binding protein